ncbi:MAG TPA: hypothetical protein ENK63_03510 [Rhodobacterales bacterium]|nr:hypothetical protein [Rhodobacterales bacterium]
MEYLEQIADGLAKEVLEIEEASGDEALVKEVMKVIGASSTTLEEAFLTAIRIRRAEARARKLIARHRAAPE